MTRIVHAIAWPSGGRAGGPQDVDIHGAITGGTWQITGNTGDIDARSTAASWATNINGNLKSLRIHGDASRLAGRRHNIENIDIRATPTA